MVQLGKKRQETYVLLKIDMTKAPRFPKTVIYRGSFGACYDRLPENTRTHCYKVHTEKDWRRLP